MPPWHPKRLVWRALTVRKGVNHNFFLGQVPIVVGNERANSKQLSSPPFSPFPPPSPPPPISTYLGHLCLLYHPSSIPSPKPVIRHSPQRLQLNFLPKTKQNPQCRKPRPLLLMRSKSIKPRRCTRYTRYSLATLIPHHPSSLSDLCLCVQQDLWMVLHDKVYSVSSFVDEHPCVPQLYLLLHPKQHPILAT